MVISQEKFQEMSISICSAHDDVIKWKHFPRYWPFVRGIHRSPVNSPHKGQWRGALIFTLVCAGIIGWVNNREAGDLRRYRTHNDVIVMTVSDIAPRYLRVERWQLLILIYTRKRVLNHYYQTYIKFIASYLGSSVGRRWSASRRFDQCSTQLVK